MVPTCLKRSLLRSEYRNHWGGCWFRAGVPKLFAQGSTAFRLDVLRWLGRVTHDEFEWDNVAQSALDTAGYIQLKVLPSAMKSSSCFFLTKSPAKSRKNVTLLRFHWSTLFSPVDGLFNQLILSKIVISLFVKQKFMEHPIQTIILIVLDKSFLIKK